MLVAYTVKSKCEKITDTADNTDNSSGMAGPNGFLLGISLPDLVQTESHRRNEDDLLNQILFNVPDLNEQYLNLQFERTLNEIAYGNALRIKVCQRARLSSFGPALNNLQEYDYLGNRQKIRLCRKVSEYKTVFVKWQTIVHNLTSPQFRYVDARRLSAYELFRSTNFNWVKDYNQSHDPNLPRNSTVGRAYPQAMIDHIMASIQECGIIEHINGDPDQINLIGKDIITEMKNIIE